MDTPTLNALLSLAIFIGVTHTIMGPDHYIPFIAMSRAGQWSFPKTLLFTFLCGIGHVGSSVVIGLLGVALGVAVGGLELIEAVRGEVAGWLLLGFGLAYTAWGIRSALRNKPHSHFHDHEDGTSHDHEHTHMQNHSHVHGSDKTRAASLSGWTIFIIFVFGPCEPLIPQLMYPAALGSWYGVAMVSVVFAIATISTMMVMVIAGYYGLKNLPSLDRYSHAIAGIAILMCGVAIKMGL